MMTTTLKRIIKAAWQGFFRDGGMALVAVFAIFTTTLLIGSLFLLKDANRVLITSLRNKVDFSVYFKEEVGEQDILGVRDELMKIPEAEDFNVDYVSKERALAEFTERHQDEEILMSAVKEVGGNPFLPSLNIRSLAANQYQSLAVFLEKPDFQDIIEKVDYQERRPLIDRLLSIASIVNNGGLIFSIILIMITVLVTFNTIRLAIYNSREEIKIQRLVGASNWFIRGPFLVQGAITGALAALSSFLILLLICLIFGPKARILFSGFNLSSIFFGNFWQILLVQLFTGIGLGVVSAYMSVRKYLKV